MIKNFFRVFIPKKFSKLQKMINGPDFINFDENGFFEKTAIFLSDQFLIHHWKALQKLSGKNIRSFNQNLYSWKKINKTLFFNFKIS